RDLDLEVQEGRLDSRAASQVGNRASRNNSAGRAQAARRVQVVARSSSRDSKVDKVVLDRARLDSKGDKGNRASPSNSANKAPAAIRNSNKDSKADVDKVDRVVKVNKASPSNSASKAPAAIHKSNRVAPDNKAPLGKGVLTKLGKVALVQAAPAQV